MYSIKKAATKLGLPAFIAILAIVFVVMALVLSCGKEIQWYVISGTISISAQSYYDIPFTANTNMRNVRLSGSFTVSGGSGNDIVALVLVDSEYMKWVSGHEVTALYSSGQVTKGTFSVPIAGSTNDTYHLIYSNRFSTSPKTVTTTVNLKYSGSSD